MRSTSNPVFRNLPSQSGGYSAFGSAAAGAGQYAQQGYGQPQGYGQQPYGAPYGDQGYGQPQATRAMTIDDVVTKTGITLGVLVIAAIASFALTVSNPALALPLVLGGALIGFVLAMVGAFTQLKFNPVLVLSYAAFEGLFLGALSRVFTGVEFGGAGGSSLIVQAVLGTVGVFAGMLIVYKTGAVRVTPRFQRMMMGALIGVVILMLGNLVAGFFTPGGFELRTGGPIAIIFSLVCIGIAAFSFLLDFDAADQMIRAQAPAKMAWGVSFGLTITLVWLYVEILRLLSYFNSSD